MDWARTLAYVAGTVDQELLARIEYLAAENRILKAQLKGRLKLSDAERATLAEIGHRLGRKALAGFCAAEGRAMTMRAALLLAAILAPTDALPAGMRLAPDKGL